MISDIERYRVGTNLIKYKTDTGKILIKHFVPPEPLLLDLLQRPWFGRAWVLQEAILSNSIRFILGPYTLDSQILEEAVRYLEGYYEKRKPDTQTSRRFVWQVRFERLSLRTGDLRHNFYSLLSTISPLAQVSELRDVVYAFLGLQRNPRIKIEPDYNKSVEEVLVTTTAAIIDGTQSLDIFSELHRSVRNTRLGSQLPSWAPDFTAHLRTWDLFDPLQPNHFKAANGRPQSVKVDNLRLVVCGKVIDTVGLCLECDWAKTDFGSSDSASPYFLPLAFIDLVEKYSEKLYGGEAAKESLERIIKVVTADGAGSNRPSNGLPSKALSKLLSKFKRSIVATDFRYGPNQVYELRDIWYDDEEDEDDNSFNVDGLQMKRDRLAMWENNRPDSTTTYLLHWTRTVYDRQVIVGKETENLGLAHQDVREGDLICILHGSNVPVILREVTGDSYRVMGQCYFEGVMMGEAVTWGEDQGDNFVLI